MYVRIPPPRNITGMTSIDPYVSKGVRTDSCPPEASKVPMGMVRGDAPFSTVDSMNLHGRLMNPKQINFHAKPFYGVLSMEQRRSL